MSKKKSNYIIYTDGGCAINPGGPGGCAAVIINTETGEYKTLSEGYVSTTNNRMEMQAIILALNAVDAVFWGLCFFFMICGTKNTNLQPWIISATIVCAVGWLIMFFGVRKKIISGDFQLQKTEIISIDIRMSGSGQEKKYTETICFANRFDTYVTHDETNLFFEGEEVYLLLINNRIKEVFRYDSYKIEYTDSYLDTCWNNNILDGKYVAVHGKENHEPRTYKSTLS